MKRLFFIFWRISKADLRILWSAFRHPDRPWWVRPAAMILVLFAIAPVNFMLPALGLVDELVLIPLLLHALVSILPGGLRYASTPIRH